MEIVNDPLSASAMDQPNGIPMGHHWVTRKEMPLAVDWVQPLGGHRS